MNKTDEYLRQWEKILVNSYYGQFSNSFFETKNLNITFKNENITFESCLTEMGEYSIFGLERNFHDIESFVGFLNDNSNFIEKTNEINEFINMQYLINTLE